MRINDYLKQKAKKLDEDTATVTTRHSLFYHRYFEGWEEEKVTVGNGERRRIVRTYTGKRYVQGIPRKRRVALRWVYSALFLGAVLCYGFAACMDVESNFAWYAALPIALALPALVLLFTSCLLYFPSVDFFRIPSYKYGARALRIFSLCAWLLLGLSMLASALYTVLHPQAISLSQVVCVTLFAIAACMAFAIWRLEGGVCYVEVPAGVLLPNDELRGEAKSEG